MFLYSPTREFYIFVCDTHYKEAINFLVDAHIPDTINRYEKYFKYILIKQDKNPVYHFRYMSYEFHSTLEDRGDFITRGRTHSPEALTRLNFSYDRFNRVLKYSFLAKDPDEAKAHHKLLREIQYVYLR